MIKTINHNMEVGINGICLLFLCLISVCEYHVLQESKPVNTQQIANQINDKIKLLRQYCPQIFQVIDNVIQNVTSTAFRVIGRVILQSGGLGGGGGGGATQSGGGGSRVSVVLPTFGPDDDDYDEDEEDEDTNEVSSSSVSSVSTEASSATTTEVGASSSTASTLEEADVRMGAQSSSSASIEADISLNILDARKPDNEAELDTTTLYTV